MKVRKTIEEEEIVVDGFSSEEEVKHEQLVFEEKKSTKELQQHREQAKLKIPPPQEIKRNSYSLNPDLETGWSPKSSLPFPIPMLFENPSFDRMINKLIDKPHEKVKLCFLGPRFENTFYAWLDKPFSFPYNHIKGPQNMKFTNRSFCGQHWEAENGIIFDSFFQSGNLDCAIQVGQTQYDLFLRVDSNTRGHLQWYNFSIKNLKKLQKYKFNLCNFQKNHSLYRRGMRPYIYSKKKAEKEGIQWVQSGDSLRYEAKAAKVAKIMHFQLNYSYKLSFEFYTEYQQDEIQIAYCIPYTYTKLNDLLKKLIQKNKKNHFLQVDKLCTSLGGLQVPFLTINDKSAKNNKKCVIVSARVHPGESNSSFMMEGLLQFLCGNSKRAQEIRRNIIFKIVPMLNPDGVALGNYRTGISGQDFNRQYRNPDKVIFPEIFSFKKFVSQAKAQFKDNFLMFLDLHGHSLKKNVFMYGPEFPIIHRNYYESRILPKIISNYTIMFRYYSCSFRISKIKQSTARAIFLKQLSIPLSYTIEASNGSFYDSQNLLNHPFVDSSWIQMGQIVGKSIQQYSQIVLRAEKLRQEKIMQKKRKKEMSEGKIKQTPPRVEKQTTYQDPLKYLLEEIKKDEQRREIQKNSDDEISERSSDREGKESDLPIHQVKQIFKIIKNRNVGSGPKKINQIKSFQLNFGEDESKSIIDEEVDPIQCLKQSSKRMFIRKNKRLRLPEKLKNQSFCVIENEKKKKKAIKVVNFSFVSQYLPRQRLQTIHTCKQRKMFQTIQNYHSERLKKKSSRIMKEIEEMSNSSLLLDLSHPHAIPNNQQQRHRHKTEGNSRFISRFSKSTRQVCVMKNRKFQLQDE